MFFFQADRMPEIFLASTSPRRIELLTDLGIAFKTIVPSFQEIPMLEEDPSQGVLRNARGKALSVKAQVMKKNTSYVIISADTIVVYKNKIFEKPQNPEDAKRMLKELSGKTHIVYTGLYLVGSHDKKTQELEQIVTTKVQFKRLKNAEIERYVNTGEPLDKSGAYGIQGKGTYFVKSIKGSFTNVVGLPMTELTDLLNQFARGSKK